MIATLTLFGPDGGEASRVPSVSFFYTTLYMSQCILVFASALLLFSVMKCYLISNIEHYISQCSLVLEVLIPTNFGSCHNTSRLE